MIPVDQTKFATEPPWTEDNTGNCMQAAVASLLELDIDDVPHFAARDDWWVDMLDWFHARGFCLSQEPTAALGLMSGQSPRGDFSHLVVACGDEVVHDPHPSRDGLVTKTEWWYLIPLDPARTAVTA